MNTTNIEWTDRVWNPVTGCTKVSPGCKHCYAETVAGRFWATQYRPMLADGSRKTLDVISTSHHEDYLANGLARPRRFTDVLTHEDRLTEPLRWRKPQKVFVNSMSDLFHEDVPDAFVDQVFAVMALAASQHTFQILTKRPDRMRAYLSAHDVGIRWLATIYRNHNGSHVDDMAYQEADAVRWSREGLPNVWIGVSVEDQQRADERIPLLLQTPAAVRFASAEPLLGPVDLEAIPLPGGAEKWYGLRGVAQPVSEKDTEPDDWKYWTRKQAKLDWVIVGGESGPGARPCDVAWVRSIVQQCQAAGVAAFVKQLGSYAVLDTRFLRHPFPASRRLADRKGADLAEWPEDVAVREFPR